MKQNIFSTPLEASRALIHYLTGLIDEHPGQTFNIALSGGTTPALMFDLWAREYKKSTPWERLRLYWVDERCVAPDDLDSNYGLTRRTLLDKVSLPAANIFRIEGENVPEEEAARYSALVINQVPEHDGLPQFDVVLLGAGYDGHTSSIFPGQEELLTTDKVYAVATQPNTGQKRVALTGRPILNARHVMFLISGKGKAAVVKSILEDADAGPAAYIAHRAANVELFLDQSAATVV
ncbi:MAG: 6-phosphogluconolactonase [Mediterranea sp.]|jgi:6-phosphogluconolactonase|nr:6-phosphogluconolactonase [Mediterranea sp.]